MTKMLSVDTVASVEVYGQLLPLLVLVAVRWRNLRRQLR